MPRRGASVGVARRGHLVELTLDLRASRGRFTPDTAAAFSEACADCADDEIWVVCLRSLGPSFCSGIASPLERWPRLAGADFVGALAALRQPVVASLRGRVEAEGFELALAADVRVVHPQTRFVMSQLEHGGLPGFGGTQRLPRVIGTERTLRSVLLGEAISARRAAEWGLAAKVSADPDREARRIAGRLLERGPIALRYAKEAIRRSMDFALDDGARFEHDLYVLLETTRDRAEGIDAFLGKRKPKFRGT